MSLYAKVCQVVDSAQTREQLSVAERFLWCALKTELRGARPEGAQAIAEKYRYLRRLVLFRGGLLPGEWVQLGADRRAARRSFLRRAGLCDYI